MEQQPLCIRLNNFDRHSHVLKLYAAHRWGDDLPCPLRFSVSPYKSCGFRCAFCYTWPNYGTARQKENFRKALDSDMERAKRLGLGGIVTMFSSSTDPFQPIELKYRDSQYGIKQLLFNDFPVLIMTRNPGMLLEPEYIELCKDPRLTIDVSVSSLNERTLAPSVNERFIAIEKLAKMGKDVKVKVDPVIPFVDGAIKAQTAEELREIVRLSKEAGASMVIAKTMRVNEDVPFNVKEQFVDYYTQNGVKKGINWILSAEIRRELLAPVLDACFEFGIKFCPCVESDAFSGESLTRCLVNGEMKTSIVDIMRGRW